jgi:hypothetical protein
MLEESRFLGQVHFRSKLAIAGQVLPGVSISQVEVRRNLLLVAVYHRWRQGPQRGHHSRFERG